MSLVLEINLKSYLTLSYRINDLFLISNIFTMLMYKNDTTLCCNVNTNLADDLLNCELCNNLLKYSLNRY